MQNNDCGVSYTLKKLNIKIISLENVLCERAKFPIVKRILIKNLKICNNE